MTSAPAYTVHPAHADLLAHSSIQNPHIWLHGRWLFIETDTHARGVKIPDDVMPQAYLADAIETHAAHGFVMVNRPGWFGGEVGAAVGTLDTVAVREVVSKLRRAAGSKADYASRMVELSPSDIVVTNRYTLALRQMKTGLQTTIRLSLDDIDDLVSGDAPLPIRMGRDSVAYVRDDVAYVVARLRPESQMNLGAQIDLQTQEASEPETVNRLEFGRMLKAIEPDRDDHRMLPQPYVGKREFDAARVSQAFAALSGKNITWSVAQNILILRDDLGTTTYANGGRA